MLREEFETITKIVYDISNEETYQAFLYEWLESIAIDEEVEQNPLITISACLPGGSPCTEVEVKLTRKQIEEGKKVIKDLEIGQDFLQEEANGA